MKRRINILAGLLALVFLLIGPAWAQAKTVYVVPVEGAIGSGLAKQVEAGLREAQQLDALAVMLEIDTPGGGIDAAEKISNMLMAYELPVIGFVTGDALSAGALITFSTDHVALSPGATIGAAEPRLGTEKADPKVVSAWTAKLANAASAHGRDGKIAAAMSDADVEIPGLIEKGKLLTLTSSQAVETGMADVISASRKEVLEHFGYSQAQVVVRTSSTAEQMAYWVTHPMVSPVLLMLGMAGLVLEIFTVGFGVAGAVGLAALALFFGGHYLAGASGLEAVLLFLVGLILLALELLVIPGFGVAGAGGIVALIVSIVLASVSFEQALISLVVALLGTVALLLVSIRFLPTRKWWQKLILSTDQRRETGYLAASEKNSSYLGKEGIAATVLRPSGTAEFDGEPVDVVTEQGYIPKGTKVRVVKVEGRRVVVRKLE